MKVRNFVRPGGLLPLSALIAVSLCFSPQHLGAEASANNQAAGVASPGVIEEPGDTSLDSAEQLHQSTVEDEKRKFRIKWSFAKKKNCFDLQAAADALCRTAAQTAYPTCTVSCTASGIEYDDDCNLDRFQCSCTVSC